MRKAIITILVVAAAASLAFADEGEQAAPDRQPKKVILKEVILRTDGTGFVAGKVDSVTPADLLTRPKSRIGITDQAGNSSEFVVKALAVIYDSKGRFLTLNDIQPGQEVQVNYITKSDDIKEAVAVRILK